MKIPVKRGALVERDDGGLQFSVTVDPAHRASFLEAGLLPNATLYVSDSPNEVVLPKEAPAQKPPTQGVGAGGIADGTVGGPKSMAPKEAGEIKKLIANPWFQHFARARLKSDQTDDERHAMVFVHQEVMKGAAWDSEAPARWAKVQTDFAAYIAEKGWK